MIYNKNDIVAKYRLFELIIDTLQNIADKEYKILNEMDQMDRRGETNKSKYNSLVRSFMKETENYKKDINEIAIKAKRELGIDINNIDLEKFVRELKFNPIFANTDAYTECKRIYNKINNMEPPIIFILYSGDNSNNVKYFNIYNNLANHINALRNTFLTNGAPNIFKNNKNIFESVKLI